MTWQEEQDVIKAAASEFPETFGMRAWPGEIFRINERSSYVQRFTNGKEVIQLVTQRLTTVDGQHKWLDFGKGQPGEIKVELTSQRLSCHSW